MKLVKEIIAVTLFFSLALVLTGCPDPNSGSASNPETPVEEPRDPHAWENELPSDYKLDNDFWDNATVYFVLTDRFYNGNTANDESYGREVGDPAYGDDVGKFYGGDIKGLTEKLDYLENLGVTAIWISCPYEQIHGYCVGGDSKKGSLFPHYPYHGYYAQDYTNVDANIGTVEEFRAFVDAAHAKGIRVVMDVVMNHPGYNTIEDAKNLFPDVLKSGYENATLSTYHNYIKYKSHGWDNWWGGSWVRAGLCSHYPNDGSGDLTGSQAYLPDFRTESEEYVSIPEFLKTKRTAELASLYPYNGYQVVACEDKEHFAVRDYLIYWLSSWVREFGIDGFRCDTAKHVEKEAWKELKTACVLALRDWKAANPTKVIPDSGDFWTTGECFGHIVKKDNYYTSAAFNSMINFAFRAKAGAAVSADDVSVIDTTYADYASKINVDDSFNALSYISSHDTGSQDSKGLFYGGYASTKEEQMLAGTLLAMCPGAIQIYYGDEAGRKDLTTGVGDNDQKNRSQMPWASDADGYNVDLEYTFDSDIHDHWAKVLNFRKAHPAVGEGAHTKISDDDAPYTFGRIKGNDKVVVVIGATAGENLEVDVSSIGAENVVDFYTGAEAAVVEGKAAFTIGSAGVLLISAK